MQGMGDGSLTFVVPVRDPLGVKNWVAVTSLIGATFASLDQAGGRVVVAATRGTALPPLPSGARLVELNVPYTPLPLEEGAARHAAVRRDKGARIIAGLVAEQPQGHVMVVDYDDFVSRRLANLPKLQPDCPGWFVDSGYVFDGGKRVMQHLTGFHRMCGTSLLVRADLLRIPQSSADIDSAFVDRSLGSHVYLKDDLAEAGTPLEPVPFPGAVYRVGYQDSTSPPRTLQRSYLSFGRLVRKPRQWVANRMRVRSAASIRPEFALPEM